MRTKLYTNSLVIILLLVSCLITACGNTTVTSSSVVATLAPTTSVATAMPTVAATPTTIAMMPTVAATTVASTIAPTTVASTATAAVPAVKLKVVATTTQIADFVKNVGGNRVDVSGILKADVDAHDYEPTADDSKVLSTSQAVFRNGLGLDDWLDGTIKSSGTKAPVTIVSEGLTLLKGDPKEGEFDPHIWFSTNNAKKMVDNIAAGLSKADAAGKAVYEANAKAYNAQIDTLTKQMQTLFSSLPAERLKLVTNHDAFGYMADQFKLNIIGSIIPSFDSTAEPSAQELKELIDKIKSEKVPAIFTETSINPKLAEQIAKEAGVKIYANLYGDSLGAADSDGDTYLKMMLTNAKNITSGLK